MAPAAAGKAEKDSVCIQGSAEDSKGKTLVKIGRKRKRKLTGSRSQTKNTKRKTTKNKNYENQGTLPSQSGEKGRKGSIGDEGNTGDVNHGKSVGEPILGEDGVIKMIKDLLNKEAEYGVSFSRLGSLLLNAGGYSWRRGYADKYGPLTNFITQHKETFKISGSRIGLLKYEGKPNAEKEIEPTLFGTKAKTFLVNNDKRYDKLVQNRRKFIYGNYDRYYGYRNNRQMWEDARFPLLKRVWFRKKKCLDIGCNSGILTVQIASEYKCSSILGVDIDPKLIRYAKENIQNKRKLKILDSKSRSNENNFQAAGKCRATSQEVTEADAIARKRAAGPCGPNPLPPSQKDCAGSAPSISGHSSSLEYSKTSENAVYGLSEDVSHTSKSSRKSDCDSNKGFPNNVAFDHGNILEMRLNKNGERFAPPYDVVLCLSVTKWIQFNWRDEGLKALFQNIWDWLLPGGIFIMEPQPWKSYRKKFACLTPQIKENYHTLKLRPTEFTAYLIDTIGFKLIREIKPTAARECQQNSVRNTANKSDKIGATLSKGFQRTIFVFKKPGGKGKERKSKVSHSVAMSTKKKKRKKKNKKNKNTKENGNRTPGAQKLINDVPNGGKNSDRHAVEDRDELVLESQGGSSPIL
mmetsp:Transcript_24751/g.48376  ORF Transcript_24751/g.48376 Transcript_24751/m.48376 type:complete len:634 (-) Transcript_24751:116-2017(-)